MLCRTELDCKMTQNNIKFGSQQEGESTADHSSPEPRAGHDYMFFRN